MASDSQPTSYAWAIYYDSRGQPNRTSTISFPSGFALASTEAGGKIVFTNTASITSTTFDPGLTVQYPPVVQPPLPPTAQPTNSESNTISATSMPLSSSSTLTSTSLSSQHAESTSPSSQSNTPSPSRSGSPLPSDHRLPNGTVAGIVIGVALGLVLLTFLAIYLVMRHKRSSGGKSRYQDSKGSGTSGPGSADQRSRSSEPKGPLVTELPDSSGALETHLPQSADDQTVQNSAKTTLDQIELHVENFYQGVARSSSQSAEADVATFNSPYLSNSLGTLLQQSSNAVPLIKHALAHFVTDSISLIANPESTLLPEEFVLLPGTVKGANASGSAKPGFAQCMSRWRVLTAYLRSNLVQDPVYFAERDQRISEIVQTFSRAFAPWRNLKYNDEDRARSLSATLKDAADLGIFIFAQPSDLRFRWSKQSEVGLNKTAVAPALMKLTNEKGYTLMEPWVMLETVMQKT